MQIKALKFKTYVTFIKNSINSKIFRNSFANIDGEVRDILENGKLSCAFYVCSVLKIFDLISDMHATVDGAIKDLEKNDWYEIENLKPGAILVWERSGINAGHRHIGFYLGDDKAVSNGTKKRKIIKHHFKYKNKRKIEKILWCDKLDN